MVDYPKIFAFCEIASCLSFTEAAHRLYTTQSSLSKSIASLEKTLGCMLFTRSNRNVTLTPAGEYLYKYFKESLHDMQQATTFAREINEGKRGHLAIGIYGLSGIVEGITEIFLDFYNEHPLYGFEFLPMTTKDARELLISQKIDAVITKEHDINLISECEYRMLCSSKLVAVARRGHPLFDVFKEPTLDDLKDYNFVNIRPSFSPNMHKLVRDEFQAHGIEQQNTSLESSYYGMLMHVASSDFIGVINESDCCNATTLRLIPIRNSPLVHIVLAWNKDKVREPLAKFIKHLDTIKNNTQE